jgi:hypothetical protein
MLRSIVTNAVNYETGEIVSNIEEKIYVQESNGEPEFIKLYLDTVAAAFKASVSYSPVLMELLTYMKYANTKTPQVIKLHSSDRKEICEKLGISYGRLNQILIGLVKHGIFKKLDRACFQVNPFLFGKGEWKDVKQIRAIFTYNERGVGIKADILHELGVDA